MELKRRLLIVCPYPQGVAPSQRLKFEQYYNYFQLNNFDIQVESFQSISFWNSVYNPKKNLEKIFWTILGYVKRVLLIFKLKKFDAVYIHLWVTPLGPPIFEYIYCKFSKKVIFDIDDLVFIENSSSANSWISRFKGKKKPLYLIKNANYVITCTPYLSNYCKKLNNNITEISSTINTDNYKLVRKDKSDGKIIIGWSGSHSTVKYLNLISHSLKIISKKYPIKIIVMGSTNFEIDEIEVECFDWKEDIEVKTIEKFDIGLYPLPDELWVQGKSGLKALQYMACGVATIASSFGDSIKNIINHGENGFLANTEEDWINYLSLLIENHELRKTIGENARKTVEEKYSVEVNKHLYLKAIQEVLK
jgi:glycosyltransferase involved in cell wall biosynthesis